MKINNTNQAAYKTAPAFKGSMTNRALKYAITNSPEKRDHKEDYSIFDVREGYVHPFDYIDKKADQYTVIDVLYDRKSMTGDADDFKDYFYITNKRFGAIKKVDGVIRNISPKAIMKIEFGMLTDYLEKQLEKVKLGADPDYVVEDINETLKTFSQKSLPEFKAKIKQYKNRIESEKNPQMQKMFKNHIKMSETFEYNQFLNMPFERTKNFEKKMEDCYEKYSKIWKA